MLVYHRLLSATPRCDHLSVVSSTKVVHTNSTKVVHMNSTKVVHMNNTKVVHTNSVHGKVVTHSNRNMSKSKGWTLQGSLLMLWMDENSSQQSNKNC